MKIWDKADRHLNLLDLVAGPMVGGPKGITIHYTADDNLDRTVRSLKGQKLGYHFFIERDGTVVQSADLLSRVNHAGVAKWRGQSPNRSHISIAVLSWGVLKNSKNWLDNVVKQDVVVRRQHQWHAATKAQEGALISLLADLCSELKIDPMDVCGHDECAQPVGRKIDPGGIFEFTMPELRRKLSSDLESFTS